MSNTINDTTEKDKPTDITSISEATGISTDYPTDTLTDKSTDTPTTIPTNGQLRRLITSL